MWKATSITGLALCALAAVVLHLAPATSEAMRIEQDQTCEAKAQRRGCGAEPVAPGQIIIEKQTLPDGDLTTFTFAGDVAGTLADGDTTSATLVPGTYTSTETVPAGWDLTDITCDDGDSSGDASTGVATFKVDPGETVKCTFTNTKRGTITADINRGGIPTGSDRGVESPAGNLAADAQKWATSSNGAQVAFINPGNVRSDLTYVQSGTEGDGVVTFGEAFTFQPFGLTLVTYAMTGAEIISVLEEQCRPPGSSRPFLHLGVSDGFTYDLSKTITTGDCTAMSVTNVMLNGSPLLTGTSYNVTVNEFLADGGDGFDTFGTITTPRLDGGNDLEALVSYLLAFSPVAPPNTDRVNEIP